MDYTQIIKIVEVNNYKEANEYLDAGWKVLNVVTKDSGHPVERHQYCVYALGWDRSIGELAVYPVNQNSINSLKQFVIE